MTACNWNAGLTDAIFIWSLEECLWASPNKARGEASSNLSTEHNQVHEGKITRQEAVETKRAYPELKTMKQSVRKLWSLYLVTYVK